MRFSAWRFSAALLAAGTTLLPATLIPTAASAAEQLPPEPTTAAVTASDEAIALVQPTNLAAVARQEVVKHWEPAPEGVINPAAVRAAQPQSQAVARQQTAPQSQATVIQSDYQQPQGQQPQGENLQYQQARTPQLQMRQPKVVSNATHRAPLEVAPTTQSQAIPSEQRLPRQIQPPEVLRSAATDRYSQQQRRPQLQLRGQVSTRTWVRPSEQSRPQANAAEQVARKSAPPRQPQRMAANQRQAQSRQQLARQQLASQRLAPQRLARPQLQQPQNSVQPAQAVIDVPAWVEGLLAAHELSQQAKTESEYTEILSYTSAAVREGAAGESLDFAKELASWAHNRRGELRAVEGQPNLASADFAAALEHQSDNWRALHNRSVNEAQSGQFAEAFDDVSRVLKLNPEFAKAYSNRATLYMQARNPAHASQDYQRALQLDPQLVAAHVGLGRLEHASGKLRSALGHFDAAVAIENGHAEIYCSRADLHCDLGEYEQAIGDYARAVDINPEFAHAYRNGAWLLATCPDENFRDAESALQGAEQALEFHYGQRHIALDTLAAAYANAGRFAEAVATLRQAIAEAPASATGAYQDRLALYSAGQPYRTAKSAAKPPVNGQPFNEQSGDVIQADHQE